MAFFRISQVFSGESGYFVNFSPYIIKKKKKEIIPSFLFFFSWLKDDKQETRYDKLLFRIFNLSLNRLLNATLIWGGEGHWSDWNNNNSNIDENAKSEILQNHVKLTSSNEKKKCEPQLN